VATADTARVTARAYGEEAATAARARVILDVAMSSIARKIFCIDWVDRILPRYSRS
jgi:hypothetical protein